MATIYSISEQIRQLLVGKDPASASRFTIQDVKQASIQAANSLLKTQHFVQNLGGGEMTPDGLVLSEYDEIAVESYGNVSRATLPAMPYSLPLNTGIFHVGKVGDPLNGFVPYEPGQMQMLSEEPYISDVLGQISYEPSGKFIYFNKDITAGDSETAINSVFMKLVVKEWSLYNDFELLPIPSDLEWPLIQETYKVLMGQYPTNKVVDVTNKEEVAK